MKKVLVFLIFITSAFLSLFAGQQAHAATFFLNQSNELADNVNYAQVDVTESAGNLNFLVTALAPTNWKFSNFYFNLDGTVGTVSLTGKPSGWNPDNGKNVSQFGVFSNGLKGTGSSLKSTFSFIADSTVDLSLANLIANAEGWIFAAHVQCSERGGNVCNSVGGDLSHHIAGPGGDVSNVPLPAAVWLFGSAMAGLGTLARRKQAAM
jgi:hypothetical protein